MARIFVSFHHALNQGHADKIRSLITHLGHTDISVNEGTKIENEELKTGEKIRQEIRDQFLKDVDVTIVVVGSDSTHRKHLDWEIRSTIHKFNNAKSGSIVVVNALTNYRTWILNSNLMREHDVDGGESRSWPPNDKITLEYFNWLPERLAKSLVDKYDQNSSIAGNHKHAVFPIVQYDMVKENINVLKFAIDQALEYKISNQGKWDTSTKMRKRNNESPDRVMYEQVEQ